MVMQFTSCCCGCSLKTGTVIIGYMSGILAFCALVRTSLIVVRVNATTALEFTKSGEAVFICMIVTYIALLIASFVLLLGTYSGRPHLIKTWIITAILTLIIWTMFVLARSIYIFDQSFVTGMLFLVVIATFVSIYAYFVMVVSSFRNQLLSQEFEYEVYRGTNVI